MESAIIYKQKVYRLNSIDNQPIDIDLALKAIDKGYIGASPEPLPARRAEAPPHPDPNYSACYYHRYSNGDQVMCCMRCMHNMEPNGEPYKPTDKFLIFLGRIPIHQRCDHRRQA